MRRNARGRRQGGSQQNHRDLRRLDFAFNNAGIEPRKPLRPPTTTRRWNRIIDIDLRGVFLCMNTRSTDPEARRRRDREHIVGRRDHRHQEQPGVHRAKHGVIGLTRAAALDYAAQNIRINVVCPGYIETPMMTRFTGGTAEGRAKVISEEPIGRWASGRDR